MVVQWWVVELEGAMVLRDFIHTKKFRVIMKIFGSQEEGGGRQRSHITTGDNSSEVEKRIE
jgi:hypothetical protein